MRADLTGHHVHPAKIILRFSAVGPGKGQPKRLVHAQRTGRIYNVRIQLHIAVQAGFPLRLVNQRVGQLRLSGKHILTNVGKIRPQIRNIRGLLPLRLVKQLLCHGQFITIRLS